MGLSQPMMQIGNTVKASFVTNQAPSEKCSSNAIPIVDPMSFINIQKENSTGEELVVKVSNPYLLENNANQTSVLRLWGLYIAFKDVPVSIPKFKN